MDRNSQSSRGFVWDEEVSGGDNEATRTLAKLKAKAARLKKKPSTLPDRLPLSKIKWEAALFQPRGGGIDAQHVSELVRAIRNVKELDPLLVMQIGNQAFLLDGHHRWMAYQRLGIRDDISVTYFKGEIDDAVLAAGRANSKAKLPMTMGERQNFAWKLVLINEYSKKKITEAAGVSNGQVAIMRRARDKLGTAAYACRTWWEARRKCNGIPDVPDDKLNIWKDRLAEQYANKLMRAFGTKLRNNPEIAAMAIERYFGRRLEELAGELRQYLPEQLEEEVSDL